ncbi:probable xyloglucan galactosyltransferase GT14 [Euphorbia lathyris]|uniref:probable xyloglucan galactosyltransferase GT14 n=1 Tax=Euphorbia lathyris TaxID=212925 RepID=UPI00331345D1
MKRKVCMLRFFFPSSLLFSTYYECFLRFVMEIPISISRNRCNHQLWFVILVSFLFFFVFICFDYSSLIGTQSRFTVFLNHYQNSNDTLLKTKPLFSPDSSCLGKYIYIHDLPRHFNQEFLDNCDQFHVGTERNMCPYLANSALGLQVENADGILSNNSWYSTNQFLLEVIFHNRMKNYKCLTTDSSIASAIYVPFYAGLEIGRYLWGAEISVRDKSAHDFVNWVSTKPEWGKMFGRDHFFVAGRISWDFRRQTDNHTDWGSKLRFLPESRNMSMLAIEASSWNNDYAIPYPTCFHPSSNNDLFEWQDKMRRQKRTYLFSFAGAPRPDLQKSIRGKIIEECQASENLCKLLECNYGANGRITCDNPVSVMKLFQNSVFCLQPTGDSYTRRSMFDSILAGCIPVFFHPGTAYAQYKWHLPKNYKKYSVFISVKDVKEWKDGINKTLGSIGEDRVLAMREEVISLIPRIMYADPRSRLDKTEDAFDLALNGILQRVDQFRKLIREGKDPSIGFADSDDYKYTFSGYVGEN